MESWNIQNFGESVRRKYVEHYILEVYLKELKHSKTKMNVCHFNYLAYLITVMKNQTMSLREIFLLKQIYQSNYNLFQKQMISYFYQLAHSEYSKELKAEPENKSQILDIILYDESLEECEAIYKVCFESKLQLLKQISNDYINIISLENNASQLYIQKTILLSNLQRLFFLNCANPILRRMCEGFEECLSIDQIFQSLNDSIIKQGKDISYIPLYEEDSVAIYITLMSEIGKILKVSKNFSSVVPINQSNIEIIGKNINSLQVDEVATVHNKMLLRYIQKQQAYHEIRCLPFLIGRDDKGWSVAYSFKIQLCILNNQELGACGLLKRISNGNMYMMITSDSENYKILLTDQRLFENIFGTQFSQQEIKKIHLSNITPSLKIICQGGISGIAYDIILIKPTSMKHALKERINNQEGMFDGMMEETLIQIKFSFHPIKNEFLDILQIQVYSILNLNLKSLKRNAIRNLKLQLRQLNYFQEVSYSCGTEKMESKNELENFQAEQGCISESEKNDDSKMLKDIVKSQKNLKNEQSMLKEIYQENCMKDSTNHNQKYYDNNLKQIREQTKIEFEKIIPLKKCDTLNFQSILSQDSTYYSPNDHKTLFLSDHSSIKNQKNIKKSIVNYPEDTDGLNEDTSYLDSGRFKQMNISDRWKNQKNIIQRIDEKSKSIKSLDQSISLPSDENIGVRSDKKIKAQLQEESTKTQKSQISSAKQILIFNDYIHLSENFIFFRSKIINTIHSKDHLSYLKLINILGIVSIIMICILNVTLFIVQYQNLEEQKVNFLQIYWSFTVKQCFTYIFALNGIIQNVSLNFYTYDSYSEMTYLKALAIDQSKMIYQHLKKQIFLLEQGDPDIKVFRFANEQLINFSFANTFNLSQSSNITTVLTSQLLYFETHIYYIVEQNDPYLNNLASVGYNIKNIFYALDNIYNLTIQDFHDKIDFRKLLLTIQLIVISLVSGIFSLLILPIKVFNQKKREEILKLLATIQTHEILSMIQAVRRRLNEIEQQEIQNLKIFQSAKNFSLNFQLQSRYQLVSNQNVSAQMVSYPSPKIENKFLLINMKKRNISSTNNLPKLATSLVVWVVICLICVEFYPIACYIIGDMYLKSFSASLTFISKYLFNILLNQQNSFFKAAMDYLFDNMNSMFSSQNQLTFIIKAYQNFSEAIVFYIEWAKTYYVKTPALLSTFNEEFKMIKSFKGIGQSDIKDFLIPLIEGDTCTILINHPQFFQTSDLFFDQCQSLFNGAFSNGILLTIQKFENLIDSFMQGVDEQNLSAFDETLIKIQKEITILDENFVMLYFYFAQEAVHGFFLNLYMNQYDDNIKISSLLIVLQIVVLFFIMILGWRRFYQELGLQFFSTKQIFDLIDASVLLNNSYIISFFKKNHSY